MEDTTCRTRSIVQIMTDAALLHKSRELYERNTPPRNRDERVRYLRSELDSQTET